MNRKIISQLIQWKNNPNRKPLVLLGARQVGKTWIMQHFGETEKAMSHRRTGWSG